ncbi:ENHANCED DISEASE RESISTANCE 2 [Spatholobus suberectus]|nr:ENHANCED DISEASE RESISTANCE 2 [Spatholobus suberectus]
MWNKYVMDTKLDDDSGGPMPSLLSLVLSVLLTSDRGCIHTHSQLGVNIGTSTVARGVVSFVLGYLNHLVIEMAFLIQGNTHEELPEFLLGTCHLNHLDAFKSVCLRP